MIDENDMPDELSEIMELDDDFDYDGYKLSKMIDDAMDEYRNRYNN